MSPYTKQFSALMAFMMAAPLAMTIGAGAPEASATSPEFRPSASEGVKNYCTAPSAKEELKKLAESRGDRNRYAADLAFNRTVCAQLQIAALAEVADADTAAAAVDAISSITREETDQAILETAVEELKNLALKYESVSKNAMLGIRDRLIPLNPALKGDEFVRQRAVSSMGDIGHKYESLRPAIVQDLLFMAMDEAPAVRYNVAVHLGRFVTQHEVTGELYGRTLEKLGEMTQDESGWVRNMAGMYLTPASPAPQP